MTKRPALVPARGGRRDEPQQSDLPAPAPRGPRTEPPRRGRAPTTPPPSPWQTDPPAAGQTAPGARACHTAPAEHAAGRDARRQAAGHDGATPPPRSPPNPPLRSAGCRRRATEAPALYPLLGQGEVPPPPERAAAPGGERRKASTPGAPTPPPACSHRDRDRQAHRPAPADKGATRTTPGINTQTRI